MNQFLKDYFLHLKNFYRYSVVTFLIGSIVSFVPTFSYYNFSHGPKKATTVEEKTLTLESLETSSEAAEGDKDASLVSELLEDSEEVCVDVAGAVTRPGVYCMDKGSLVVHAIGEAGDIDYGSYATRYVAKYINYAREIRPNEKIYIPFGEEYICEAKEFSFVEDLPKDEELIAVDYSSGKAVDKVVDDYESSDGVKEDDNTNNNEDGEKDGDEEADCISINNATLAELQEINGVGESTAIKIMDGRPYESIEDLLDVNGIGEVTLDKMRDQICL
jgi:competence protein ComEA